MSESQCAYVAVWYRGTKDTNQIFLWSNTIICVDDIFLELDALNFTYC
jgi:hypothetical protein